MIDLGFLLNNINVVALQSGLTWDSSIFPFYLGA